MAEIEHEDGVPILVHYIGSQRYSFCVKDFNPDKLDWLCEIVGRHMDNIHRTAVLNTKMELKENIRKALSCDV